MIDDLIPEVRRSARISKPVDRLLPTENLRYRRLNETYRDRSKLEAIKILSAGRVPFKIAIKDDRIRESVRKEIKLLFDIGCISIVSLPPDRNAGPDVKYLRTKSRICPWGFQQISDIHYNIDEVAAPTLHNETCMLLLAITVQRNVHSKLLDVDGAID